MSRFLFPFCLLVALLEPLAGAPFKQIAPQLFENGAIRVDGARRSVSFQARVNMQEGALEYGIVTPAGPVHESLLVTAVDPIELHAAFLLVGIASPPKEHQKPLDPSVSQGAPSGPLSGESLKSAPPLSGKPVQIRLLWKHKEEEHSANLEDWLLYRPYGRAAERGPWTYTGSIFSQGVFAAKEEGCVLCLVTSEAAMINNPRQGRTDDRAWEVFKERVPEKETAVTVEVVAFESSVPTP